MSEKILRLHFSQPSAHYRVGFTQNNVHRTYPLPPPSTILGMLHNLMGCKQGEIIKEIDIAIAGKYESIFYQYQLFRNLYNVKVKSAYKEASKGSPMPVQVQQLYNNDLYIYIKSNKFGKYSLKNEQREFSEIIDAFENPQMPFIIGRREDLAVLEGIKHEGLEICRQKLTPGGFKNYSFWSPMKDDRQSFKGITYLLTTYYNLENGIRNFERERFILVEPQDVELKIIDNKPYIPEVLVDKELNLPVEFLLRGEPNG